MLTDHIILSKATKGNLKRNVRDATARAIYLVQIVVGKDIFRLAPFMDNRPLMDVRVVVVLEVILSMAHQVVQAKDISNVLIAVALVRYRHRTMYPRANHSQTTLPRDNVHLRNSKKEKLKRLDRNRKRSRNQRRKP
jgi:hypothetical protein